MFRSTRQFTVMVAASDAEQISQTESDYLCDGVEDDAEIQAALDSLPSTGGKIVLSEGTFTLSAQIVRAIDDVAFEGSGAGTNIVLDGATAVISAGTQAQWAIRYLNTDAGGINIASATESIGKYWLNGVWTESGQVGSGGQWTILSPAQITEDKNNWNPGTLGTSSVVIIDMDAAWTITGMLAPSSAGVVSLVNTSLFALTLSPNNGSSDSANRFDFGNKVVITSGQGVLLFYDTINSNWKQISSDGFILGSVEVDTQFSINGMLIAREGPTVIISNVLTIKPDALWTTLSAGGNTVNLNGIPAGTLDQVALMSPELATDIITLKHNTASTGKKMMISGGSDVTLETQSDFAIAIWDNADDVWRVTALNSNNNIGRSSSFTVASSTSNNSEQYDYICSGASDDVQIQSAIDDLGSVGSGHE